MGLQDIIGALAPNTANQIERIANPGASQGGSILGIPVALASDVITPPLQIANAGAGMINQIPQKYPQLANLIGGLGALAVGINGDPTAAARIKNFQAQQQMQEQQMQAMQLIQQQYPNFDPTNRDHVMGAARIVGSLQGPEEMSQFITAMQGAMGGFDLSESRQARKNFQVETADYQVQEDNYAIIVNALNTGVGGVALITAYAKLLDPGSVVRQSEFGAVLDASGMSQKMVGLFNSWLEEGKLPETVTRNLRDNATAIINQVRGRTQKKHTDWQTYVVNQGGDPEDIMPGFQVRAPRVVTDSDEEGNRIWSDEGLYENRSGAPDVPFDVGIPYGSRMVWDTRNREWVVLTTDGMILEDDGVD